MSDTESPSSGTSQQEVWRNRLAAAEAAYRDASSELQKAVQQEGAVAAAREQKNQARLEYLRILRIFTDLVLRGKSPP